MAEARSPTHEKKLNENEEVIAVQVKLMLKSSLQKFNSQMPTLKEA